MTAPPAPATPKAADKAAPVDSVAAAIENANLMLRIGNVAGARAALEAGVKARNGEAISELGRTYDPNELQAFLLVPPGTADAAKAVELYTEAARLGSTSARVRLERLKAGQPTPPAPAKQK